MFKKSVIAAVVSASTVGAVVAAEQKLVFRMQANGTVSLPEWVVISHNYTTWLNTGGEHSCQEWLVPTNQVDWGQNFQQSRSCLQTQERQATPILLNPILGTQKEGSTFTETRNIGTTQFQPAIGIRDYITGETSGPWGVWGNTGSPYSCDVWAPEPDTVNLFDPFTQTRDCQQDQMREQQVFHTWASGAQTPKRIDSGNQTITVTESRANQGTRDYITGERLGAWTPWVNVGGHYNCGTWSPAPSSQMANFTQTRDCSQNQTGSRDVFNVFRSGAETFNRTEPRNQTITEVESRLVTATAGSWSNTTVQNCGTWGPAPTTQTSSFTQTRACDQNQARTWTYTSGDNIGTYTEQRTVEGSATESRTVTVSWTAWANSGSPYSCTTWSPSTGSVNFGQSFTQSRNCSQNQTRTRNYSNGSSFSESQTVTITQTQGATGTYQNWVSTSPSCGGWSYGGYSYGSWSPAPSTQTSSFTQTRSYSRPMSRSCQPREYDTVTGGFRNVGSAYTENNTDSGTESRTVTVSWSGWSNSGGTYNCTAWSPDPSTVNQGIAFTQTQTCSQNQTRSRNYSNGSSFTESQTIVVYPTRNSTGTKSTRNCSGSYEVNEENDGHNERIRYAWYYTDGGSNHCETSRWAGGSSSTCYGDLWRGHSTGNVIYSWGNSTVLELCKG